MWIAVGLVCALWFAGTVIFPDKNAPQPSHAAAPPAAAAVAAATTPAQQ
jgi:hypothetical protein